MTDDEILAALRERVAQGRPTDLTGDFPLDEPASPAAISEAEQIIGYPLPPLLKRIYREIANGGIGPDGGFEGLRDGYVSDEDSMLDVCTSIREDTDEPPILPPGVLFFCNSGCAMWDLLDCRDPEGRMWSWDSGERHRLDITFTEWISAWLEDRYKEVVGDPARRLPDE
ncbi:hypothetical protein FB565_008850 [Actinoplanes lutulentus]|uniref:SMI1/KNR4 family protein SUKH-1 n=1 Tax=Actinoplanes lutulentus TaxID=1287878 RepID=A0A327ZA35_9ACTN|nr:SMI1/KNR4 family protein [Actinoplanes lutulentus]MBB2949045.1 hypothetical protein [Actinoplanes lutulentus]RAK31368.1 SMI1/KNR4 family protein SUKH-1 [Actinoplanes lutulentus]